MAPSRFAANAVVDAPTRANRSEKTRFARNTGANASTTAAPSTRRNVTTYVVGSDGVRRYGNGWSSVEGAGTKAGSARHHVSHRTAPAIRIVGLRGPGTVSTHGACRKTIPIVLASRS